MLLSSPPFSPSHLVDAHVQVLALCTDKLESSMLYDRFIRGRLVRRFKNADVPLDPHFLFHALLYSVSLFLVV